MISNLAFQFLQIFLIILTIGAFMIIIVTSIIAPALIHS